MRIAFQTYTGTRWLAGMLTFQDLFVALQSLSNRPRLELVRWRGTPAEDYELLNPFVDDWLSADYPSPSAPAAHPTWKSRVRQVVRSFGPTTPRAETSGSLRASGVDCTFSVVLDGRTDTSVPLLVWIYDLQHHHFPELASEGERLERDRAIAREAQHSTLLIAKSKSVAQDIARFFPQAQTKVRTLGWVAHIPESIYTADPAIVARRFHLPDKFLILPNQFWAHKNHVLVLEALRRLKLRGILPVVVCTGGLYDHRNPDYLGTILQTASEQDLREQFIVLGMIPRDDLLALMRQSIAILNPSRFEGFGLSAAEAKSLGKRTLLSDLPSLREQDPPQAIFFDSGDAAELADCLEHLWRTVPAGPDLEMESSARAALPARQREFALDFVGYANEAIELFQTGGMGQTG